MEWNRLRRRQYAEILIALLLVVSLAVEANDFWLSSLDHSPFSRRHLLPYSGYLVFDTALLRGVLWRKEQELQTSLQSRKVNEKMHGGLYRRYIESW